MTQEKEIKNLCDALQSFKSHQYTIELDHALKKVKTDLKTVDLSQEEHALHAFREIISRYLIDLYDVLDRATKDLDNETDINHFWNSVRHHVEAGMKEWILNSVNKHQSLKDSLNQIYKDIDEFHDRAIKFHRERQIFSLSLRNKIATEESQI